MAKEWLLSRRIDASDGEVLALVDYTNGQCSDGVGENEASLGVDNLYPYIQVDRTTWSVGG